MLPSNSLEPILQAIGDKLYSERHNRREKITWVASNIGVSHPVISKIEHGRYKCLSIELLCKLADYYHLSVEDLLHIDSNIPGGFKPIG